MHLLREGTNQSEQPSPKQETPTEFEKGIEADSDFTTLLLDPRVPNKTVCIGAKISPHEQVELLQFLDKNSDIFVWFTSDLVGVSREVIEYKLHVNPNVKPKKQKLHKMSEEKIEVVKADVQRLLDIGFIREVTHPQWLANIMMVHKKNGKW
jgi:hypothetical protein